MSDEPGLQPFDLTAASKSLAAMIMFMPLRAPLSGTVERRAKIRAENANREARVAAELVTAQRDWDTLHAALAGNQPSQAALHIHKPEAGYERVECDRCMQGVGFESAEPTPWPCGTFTAIREAADT